MELAYLELRFKSISDSSQDIKQFKARLVNLVYLNNRSIHGFDHQIRDNLEQLDQEIAASKLNKTPSAFDNSEVVGFICGMIYWIVRHFYEKDVDVFVLAVSFIFVNVIMCSIIFARTSYNNSKSAILNLRDICATLILAIDRQNNITH
ncbi:hypothetical protein BC940DRAFT_322656 [Gongronella butleri]|nr:hypothetical protein BC940DRAFT_322656 [Gongronella butleri]